MNKNLWIKINTNNYYYTLTKLNNIGINILDNIKDKDYILIKTNESDYERIKKYLISYDTTIYSKTGIFKYFDYIKKYWIFIIASIISIILLLIVNMMVFKIDIKSPNKEIQELLIKELNNNGLKRFSLKKKHNIIEEKVNKILDDNKDILEWLEIKYDGLVMVVNVTEKTKINKIDNYNNCDIIASRDAKISSLNIYRGIALKEINDYVLKGDVILSGSIIYNNEVKNNVCASGEVYGEVWYKVKVEVPFIENYIKYTGKNHYNISVMFNDKEYNIFKSKVKDIKKEKINLYKLNDFEINLVKMKEYQNKVRTLSEKEAYDKGIKLALEKINLTLDKDEEIILKKVLKKEVNDSTIYLEIFVVTKENIGLLKVVEEDSGNGLNINTESIQ